MTSKTSFPIGKTNKSQAEWDQPLAPDPHWTPSPTKGMVTRWGVKEPRFEERSSLGYGRARKP